MKRKITSGLMLTLLAISMLTLAFNIQLVKASGTIYIRADGSVEGTIDISSADNITYTFTANIYDSIVVERENIVVDGADYTLQGTGSGYGFNLTMVDNITIRNMEIKEFYDGILLTMSSSNSIYENNIKANADDGISLDSSSNNSIYGNNITNNDFGIYLSSSSNNTVSGNNITENDEGIVFSSSSSNNSISGNNITNNEYGIYLSQSSNNNSISGNNITNNFHSIRLDDSSNNTISGNNITENDFDGICLSSSSNNSISGNNITNNDEGICLYFSSNNSIFHNNFINNIIQAYSRNSTNFWDDGYASGGNYWSDYTGEDVDGDGIGDTPYEIDANNKDRYPLMEPWPCEITPTPVEEVPFWMQWWFWTIVAIGIVALAGTVYFLKKRKPPTAPTPPSEGTV